MKNCACRIVALFSIGTFLVGCPCDENPSASFTAAPVSGTAPLDVAFTDTSVPGPVSISRWLWSFGDGASSAAQHPVHTYANAGTYAVSLTVTTAQGGDTASSIIRVSAASDRSTPPAASFEASPVLGIPLRIAFTDTSSGGGAAIAAWTWSFGDGEESGDQNPIHTYNAAGVYDVTLTVTSGDGAGTAHGVSVVGEGAPAIWCVMPGGTGTGVSWESPLGAIQDAVDAAAAAGGGEVWVAEGTYLARYRDAYAVSLRYGAALYGGFLGGETVRQERDWAAHATIVDGESACACVYGADETVLDGFTIRNGSASRGGGMYNLQCAPRVAHCTFSTNAAGDGGAAIYNDAASPMLVQCAFSGNTSSYGGGVYNRNASPAFVNCTFTGNMAYQRGGGLYNTASSPTLTGCVFDENKALSILDGRGGGICNEASSNAVLAACVFTENSAASRGGALYNDHSSPAQNECSFRYNVAFVGGAIQNVYASPAIVNAVFFRNMSRQDGGAISNNFASPAIANSTFNDNQVLGTSGIGYGGAVSNRYTSAPRLVNCVLWGDSAASGGDEIYNYSEPSYAPTADVTFSCVEGGYAGAGNLAGDPLFVDIYASNLHLQTGSPCIDAGTASGAPFTDFDGVERPQGDGVDMGAYEYETAR